MLQLSPEDMSANRRLFLKIGSVLISMALKPLYLSSEWETWLST